MGFAANAIMDVVAPPTPARASNASADGASASSFQDHVDASDQHAQRNDPPRSKRETHTSSDHPSSPPASDRGSAALPDASQDDAKQDAEAQAAPTNPPVLLQLIANVAPAVLGAKMEQPAPAQQETAPVDQGANASIDPAVALAAGETPPKAAPKSDAAPRTPQVKTAKGAAKTAAMTDDTKATMAQPATPTLQEPGAQAAAAPSLAPTIADGNAKAEDGAKAGGIEKVQSDGAHPAPQTRQQALAPSAPRAPELAAAPQQPDGSQAKNRDGAKAAAPMEALKQGAQDLAAPKAQLSAPPPAHAQLAEPVQQVASDANAARVAPAAAQVGGEIIRRFNGHDTSFQLRLDPPELGRVDVRIDVSRDHRVTAVISADSPQALSDLARGARDLQQALQSAGLDVADDGLRFDLSSNGQGNSFGQTQAQQDQSALRAANTLAAESIATPEATASRPLSIDRWRGARVDLVA